MGRQSLANNLCKDAAGAIGGLGSYIVQPDMDEFLSPPTFDARQTRLSGSLAQLARRVHSGQSSTAIYIEDERIAHSRVRVGRGAGRCLSFAGVTYLLPPCTAEVTAAEDPRPAVLRLSWRGQPDNFEYGPSYNCAPGPLTSHLHGSKTSPWPLSPALTDPHWPSLTFLLFPEPTFRVPGRCGLRE